MTGKYTSLKEKALSVKSMLEKYQKVNYPIPYLNQLYKDLIQIYEKVIIKFFNDDQKTLNENLNVIFNFIEKSNDLIFNYLSKANQITNPLSLTIPIKEILQKHDASAIYIPLPISETNYFIGELSQPFNNMLKSIGIDDYLDIKIFVFGIPYYYQNNMLMSGIIGHELGHYFDIHGGLNISQNIINIIMNDDDFINDLSHFWKFDNDEITNPIIQKELFRSYIVSTDNFIFYWVQEFVADILGVMLYGPSSIFAGERLVQPMVYRDDNNIIDIPNMTHPRNSVRFIMKMNTLNRLGYEFSMPEEFLVELNKIKTFWDSAGNIDINHYDSFEFSPNITMTLNINNMVIELVENYLMDKFESMFEFSKSNLSQDLIYSPKIMNERIYGLNKRMDNLLPPNEISFGIPSDNISILNTGWLSYFSKEKYDDNKNGEFDYLLMINDMMAYAVDRATIHRRWYDVNNGS